MTSVALLTCVNVDQFLPESVTATPGSSCGAAGLGSAGPDASHQDRDRLSAIPSIPRAAGRHFPAIVGLRLFLAQGGVNSGYSVGRYISLLRELMQLLQDLMRLVSTPGRPIHLAKPGEGFRTTVPKLNRRPRGGDGEFMKRLASVCPPKPAVRWANLGPVPALFANCATAWS